MSKSELAIWQLCGIAGISRQAIRNNSSTDDEVERFCEAGRIFGGSKLLAYDRPGMDLAAIRHLARKHKREGLAMLVVDYLQLIAPDDKRAQREQQVAAMSRGLKTLAGELDIPVLCLCQLNRQAEDGEEPKLRHLRESGAIEQDASMILFLWRTKDCSKLAVAKNRATGTLGSFELNWSESQARYESAQPANYEPAFASPSPVSAVTQGEWWSNRQEDF
jgi:replicative DNA helicase